MKFDDFKRVRRRNAFNRFLQITLSLTLALGLNFLASQPGFQKRWDLGSESRHSLSFETQKYLKSVGTHVLNEMKKNGETVHVYTVLSSEGTPALRTPLLRLSRLLEDVSYESVQVAGGEWLNVEAADSVKNAGIRSELENRFGTIGRDVALIVAYGSQYKYITLPELLRVRNNETGEVAVDAFKGESVLVAALLEVTDENKPVVYLTSGHGEMSSEDRSLKRGLSSLTGFLRMRNLNVRTLDLMKFSEVPKDARLVIVPSPRSAFRPQEVEKLRRYMRERNGRIIALVDVGIENGLTNLFDDWGILSDDARAWDKSPEATATDGDMRLLVSNKDHELSRVLAASGQGLFVSEARPVRIDPAGPALDDKTLRAEELVGTSPNSAYSWCEFDYKEPSSQYRYDAARDIAGPICVATIAERTSGRDRNLKITRGRLLVIGSGSIAANARINESTNSWFMTNAVDWMLEREQLLKDIIPARPIAEFKLKASMVDLKRVAWRFALLPAGILLLGIAVHLWRRGT